MKQFTSDELRKTWKQFYIDRGHVDVGAVSLVSDGSTGVLFNVAGMQPLMPYLLGKKHPLGTRLCNVQGCVRTNDIDSVGDKSHGTFFEMLGSWSLGDYFKEERCKWSYELLTEVFGFDADHLAATVFAGDENAPRDEEGAQYRIASGFKKENIYYLPAEDNWWGLEYGPCGPDSEMFYIEDRPDCGPDCGPGCHCGKYTELGNDVFMQYEKHQDGTLTPLKQKNVDTGWGLERVLAFLNGTRDVYRIDLYAPVIAYIEKVSGTKYEQDEKLTRSMRILADHIRTSVMLIGDEAKLLPSNAGAGYVLRRLIRRAVRHARILGLKTGDILKIGETYIREIYGESYPLLVKNQEFVLSELKKEIDRFESTLENGMREFRKILDARKGEKAQEIDGKAAFYLYDTFGFPLELTVELAEEEGLKVDEKGFAEAMEKQKQLARDNQNFSAKLNVGPGLFDGVDSKITSEFTGYDTLADEDTIAVLASETEVEDYLEAGQAGTVIVRKTPFYATMGGQKGDIGMIRTPGGVFEVQDTVKVPGGRIGHVGRVVSGRISAGEKASLEVAPENRRNTCKNHSATHLLQKALREVLGDHVEQSGSYVDGERLRFDFSHSAAMTKEELERVEALVNEKIAEDLPVVTEVMSLEEAKKTGAMALFGEKYGDSVRVVRMGDFSVELCGGTHVAGTGMITLFKILSESGVAAGVRRIEALTGSGVLQYYKNLEQTLEEASKALKATPATLVDKCGHVMAEMKSLHSELESLKAKAAKDALGDVMEQVKEVKGVKLLAARVDGVDMNGLRDLGDQLKAKLGEGVVVLLSDKEGKVNMIAMATDGALAKGAHAGNLIKGTAALVGGGGGGRPNMAQAGGKNPAGIPDAVAEAAKVLESQIG
ncbi:MAG: alanine--tRNA ligase [Eubacterium sp.]|nr:alanine--tRNA ligase [Eubacterium sp.]MCM1304302.1 alanine--tRNA ligase [Butyrivibrio sp.]MCM1344049.1 alanine--tRNA ligase [Muribaculaceae bacterium]MCM1409237.1 alanine--tRNA ligase [Lachnospiraceae bacterium]